MHMVDLKINHVVNKKAVKDEQFRPFYNHNFKIIYMLNLEHNIAEPFFYNHYTLSR